MFCRLLPALGLLSTATCAWGLEVWVQDGAGKPLPGAAVFVESAAARQAVKPLKLVEVTQQQRQFQPQLSIVPVGTAVTFPNLDTVRHHVYSFSPTKKFEIKLYVGTPSEPVLFDRAGIAVLGCNIHDNMHAWVLVVASPWYGTTDAQGRLSLPAVPPGQHVVKAWHPSLPASTAPQEAAVTVPAAGSPSPTARLRLPGAGA